MPTKPKVCPHDKINVKLLLEHIGDDPDLLVDAIRTLCKIARTTCNQAEKAEICAALAILCGKDCDPDPPLAPGQA